MNGNKKTFVKKWLSDKFGKEFYNDLGSLKTAEQEAEQFIDDCLDEYNREADDWASFEEWAAWKLEGWTEQHLSVSDYAKVDRE